MAETIEQLREENIRLRQQAHYWKSMHEKAAAKLREAEAIIVALKQKLAEWARKWFGRGSEKTKAGLPARVVAPPPARLIERGVLSVESIVEGLLRKFLYYTPIQRVVDEWRELGVEISSGTWCGIFARLGRLFQPLGDALLEACRADGRWLMDETRWAVFVVMEGKESNRWWLWVIVSPRVTYYILSERAIRGAAIGRNNFYGSGSVWSGELLAMMLTIMKTAQKHKVNVRRYLVDYLKACAENGGKAPQDLNGWLPWNYQPKETASGP